MCVMMRGIIDDVKLRAVLYMICMYIYVCYKFIVPI